MKLFDFAYCGMFGEKIDALAAVCPENWGSDPARKNSVLHNYIKHTFSKLYDEFEETSTHKDDIIKFKEKYFVFNTGLYDVNWQKIFAYFIPRNNPEADLKWSLDGFYTEYQLSMMHVDSFPRRANYFLNVDDLVFNVNYGIVPQYDHIFDETNNQRIPSSIRDSYMKVALFNGAIEIATKRIDANYKTAVPQYFKGKIQLLVPLFLTNPTSPDLALVVTKDSDNKRYLGHTCLTTEMAYNNARLIARPDSDWLHP